MKRPLLRFLALVLFPVLLRAAGLPTPDPDDGGLTLPQGFRALVVADNLVVGRKQGNRNDTLRFIALAPNGDIYAKTERGGIFALHDSKGNGRADVIKEFSSGGGTGIAFHDGWLYHSSDTAVFRYRYTPGELIPSAAPETIIHDLPLARPHTAKAFAFDDDGHLLVEVGSPSNSLGGDRDRKPGAKGLDPTEEFKTFSGFWRFDPSKPDQIESDGLHFVTGMRRALSLDWNPVSRSFFMVMMGRDQLNTVAPQYYDELDNAERIAEEMHQLHEGVNLGWPVSYYDPFKKARMVSPEYGGDNCQRVEPGKYDDPLLAFPAHWAPLQMAFYSGTQFPARYRHGAFIAFHGSWNRAPLPQAGYKVCFVPFNDQGLPTGEYEVFADGFTGLNRDFTTVREARFRPCGLAVGPDGSLYVGDSEKGRIWRIIYTGETSTASRAAPGSSLPAAAFASDGSRGEQLYRMNCASCHMPDGSGVSSMQPALMDNAEVAGDSGRLIDIVLRGPAAVLPPNREHYQNAMPAFSTFNDQDLSDLLNYIRRTFGHQAPPVTAAQVASRRTTP